MLRVKQDVNAGLLCESPDVLALSSVQIFIALNRSIYTVLSFRPLKMLYTRNQQSPILTLAAGPSGAITTYTLSMIAASTRGSVSCPRQVNNHPKLMHASFPSAKE